MHVWGVASTFDSLTILVQGSFLIDLIVRTVEVIDVSGDLRAFGIRQGPGPMRLRALMAAVAPDARVLR